MIRFPMNWVLGRYKNRSPELLFPFDEIDPRTASIKYVFDVVTRPVGKLYPFFLNRVRWVLVSLLEAYPVETYVFNLISSEPTRPLPTVTY